MASLQQEREMVMVCSWIVNCKRLIKKCSVVSGSGASISMHQRIQMLRSDLLSVAYSHGKLH